MIDRSEGDASYKRIITAKLDAILGLCETISCRRVALLDYFDESLFLKRVSRLNGWKQVSAAEAEGAKYGEPYKAANALLVGRARG